MSLKAVSAVKAASPVFGKGVVEAISAGLNEPKWMKRRRLEALDRFESGETSFGRYSRLLSDWRSMKPRAPLFEKPFFSHPLLGPVISNDDHNSGARLLSTAARENETLLNERLAPVEAWENLVMSGWTEGLHLRWKRDEGGEGRISYLSLGYPAGLVFEPVAIDVERGAEASLFLHWRGGDEPSFHLSFLGGRVASGARLKLFLLQEADKAKHYLSSRFSLGQDASVEIFTASTQGPWRVSRFNCAMDRPGSSWKESHLVVTAGREHYDMDSRVGQSARFTKSDVRIAAAAMDSSRTVFTGNILMEKSAGASEARLADRVLLLDPGAHADSIPGLEIKALDVAASHAAAIGRVDDEQLFYLESRGLSPEEARRLLVTGFLGSLFDRVPFEVVPELLGPILERKVS